MVRAVVAMAAAGTGWVTVGVTPASACANPGAGAVRAHDETFFGTVVSVVDRTSEVPTAQPPFRWLNPSLDVGLRVDTVYSGSLYASEHALVPGPVRAGARYLFVATRGAGGGLQVDGCTGIYPAELAAELGAVGQPPNAGADPAEPVFGAEVTQSPGAPVAIGSAALGVLVAAASLLAWRRRTSRSGRRLFPRR